MQQVAKSKQVGKMRELWYELSDDCYNLAWGSARLEETLMDGVLQELLVVAGHGRVAAASSPVVPVGHLKHRRRHLKRSQPCADQSSGSEMGGELFVLFVKPAALLPAPSSSSPEDVGVAAGVGAASSSVLHLFTLPNVILAFSTWNNGISVTTTTTNGGKE